MFAGPCVCLDKPLRKRLMQDGATSHTTHTTLNLLQAHRVNVLSRPYKSPDTSPIEHIWDVIGRVAICKGRMERNCTAHMSEVRGLLKGHHRSDDGPIGY